MSDRLQQAQVRPKAMIPRHRLEQVMDAFGLTLTHIVDDGATVAITAKHKDDERVYHEVVEHNMVVDLGDARTRAQIEAGVLPGIRSAGG